MSYEPDDEFKQGLAQALTWSAPAPCENEADYDACYARRSVLSRLSDTSHALPDDSRSAVDVLLRAHENALIVYNRRFLLKDGTPKLLAKYMAWTKWFTAISAKTAYLEARDHCVLRKKDAGNGTFCFYVVGLNYEVGDNTFTTDRRGRHHRRRSKTLGRQAIFVSKETPFEGSALAEFASTVPTLAKGFYATGVGDGKGAIPAIVMPQADQTTIFKYLDSSPYESGKPVDRMDPWMGYAPPALTARNGELFA